jgi:SOS response associated peptidase (SRAP)
MRGSAWIVAFSCTGIALGSDALKPPARWEASSVSREPRASAAAEPNERILQDVVRLFPPGDGRKAFEHLAREMFEAPPSSPKQFVGGHYIASPQLIDPVVQLDRVEFDGRALRHDATSMVSSVLPSDSKVERELPLSCPIRVLVFDLDAIGVAQLMAIREDPQLGSGDNDHDRMPVILEDDDVWTWLSGDPKEAAKLMKPFSAKRSVMYPVSTYVNNARNEGVKCIETIEG